MFGIFISTLFLWLVVCHSVIVTSTTMCSTCYSTSSICKCTSEVLEDLRGVFLEPRCSSSWRHLRLNLHSLKKMQPNIFDETKCGKLQKLELYGGSPELIELKLGVFNYLNDLRELTLGFHRLTSFQPGLFLPLRLLQGLIFNRTRIDRLQVSHLKGLQSLVSLHLEGNNINGLEAGVFLDTPQLKRLSLLRNKQITLHSDTFLGLTQLVELNLTDVIRINQGAFSPMNRTLRQLNIRANASIIMNRIWGDLDNVFNGLTQLQILRLVDTRIMGNQFNGIAFRNLIMLRELDLEGNILLQIERRLFAELLSLEILSLRRCQIKCVYTRNFASLQNLRELDLSFNKLTVLPRDFLLGLDNLRDLRLSGNPLVRVQSSIFCTLSLLLANSGVIQQIVVDLNSSYEGYNITEPCPSDFKPKRFHINERCYSISFDVINSTTTGVKNSARSQDEYFLLLIIVGVCVAFLLVAIALILSYRAWSKRKNKQLLDSQDNEAQEMMPVAATSGIVANMKCHNSVEKQQNRSESAMVAATAAGEGKSLLPRTFKESLEAPGECVSAAENKLNLSSSLTASSEHRTMSDSDDTIITTLAVV